MASSRGFGGGARRRPDAPLARSNSDQLLLRKRQDFNYLDGGPSTGSGTLSARERKALADAAETAMLEQQQYQQQRSRAATATLSRLGNDQGGHAAGGGGAFRLNRKEKLFLIKRAKESAVALIDHAHTLDGPIQWHYKGKHRGIQMYRGEGMVEQGAGAGGMGGAAPGSTTTPVLGGEASSLEFLCGVTTMMGSLEEVSEYFDQATTARMRVKKAEDVLDCAVLYSLVWGNTVNPFHRVSVKYHAYEGPAAMTRPRDFCYLECQDTFRHASGRRGWVLSMHSIKIPSCPEVPGFVRGSVYHSGFVFVEAERPGYMDVMYSLQINFKGHGRVPHFMLNSALKRRLRELIHISREIQVARMAHRTLLQDKDLMPKHLRSTCVNCSRRFWLFLRKTRCRVCGEVVCQSCAPLVDYEGAGSNGQHAKTRICVKCYSTAPTTGSWTAPNENLPWTEQSHFEHKSSVPMLTPKRTMRRVKEEDDEEHDDDDDGEGRYTFAELEEQSSHSVFAPERFTRSSMASIAPLQIDEIGVDYLGGEDDRDDASSVRSSDNYWSRPTEESVFNIGSVSNSIMSRDSYFGRPDPAPPAPTSRYSMRHHHVLNSVPDDTPILMEEPEDNQVSHVNSRVSKKYQPTSAEAPKPETASAELERKAQLQQRHTTSPGGSKSSFEFLDGLIDLPLSKRNNGNGTNDPSRPRAQTTIQTSSSGNQLNPSTLRAHNLRYLRGFEHETPASSRVSFANKQPQNTPPTPDDKSHLPRASNEPVVLDDLLPSTSLSTNSTFDGNATSTSVNTNSLFSRPSSLILQQVRKNRSRTIQLQSQSEEHQFRSTNDIEDKAEDHRRRMAELNEKALAYTGTRVSNLEITRPSLQPETVEEDVWRSSALMEEYRSRRKHTIEALRKKALSIQDDNRESSGTDRTAASSPSFVGIQRIGEVAMSRSPSLSGPLSDVRTRGIYGRSSSGASAASQPYQSSLPMPPTLARNTSDASSTSNKSSPQFGKKHLLGKPSESSMRGMSEDLTFKPSMELPSGALKLSLQEEEDEDLQLSSSGESKRSSRSEEPEQEDHVTKQAPAAARKAAHEFVTPRSLYAEIGLLTQLHSEAASTEDTSEVDRIKERIQEQYQLIRTLQLK